jgi:glycosyltransferase involved in cell wall biosynthesis
VAGRLRVMHVVVGGDIGGAERVVVDLATRPERTGADHQVALITPNRGLAAYLEGAGLHVHDRGLARENPLAYLVRSLGRADVAWLAGLLTAERINVVHTHTFGSHVLGTRAALRARTPQLRTEHHVMHYTDASSSAFTRWAAARTERIVTVSEYVRRAIGATAPRVGQRATVVRNGVDTEYWAPREAPGGGASGDAFRLGVVCRLTGWKRVGLAVEAAARAGVELLVVGDGEERPALGRLARGLGARVEFAGYQADPRPWIARCDAVVSTARDEPLGLSVLEALAMGRPVLAFAAGGIPEIVEHGVTGWLVTGEGPHAMAAAIAGVRHDRPRLRSMGIAARRLAVERFAVERMCDLYAAAYRETSRPS